MHAGGVVTGGGVATTRFGFTNTRSWRASSVRASSASSASPTDTGYERNTDSATVPVLSVAVIIQIL